MAYLSITQVSNRYKISRNTVAHAAYMGYLKSTRNTYKEYLILEEDANFYFKGPPFPYWWCFQQIASLGIPISILYTMRDRCQFRCIKWKGNLYAYVPGEYGIEIDLKALGFLTHSKPMLQMERPILDN